MVSNRDGRRADTIHTANQPPQPRPIQHHSRRGAAVPALRVRQNETDDRTVIGGDPLVLVPGGPNGELAKAESEGRRGKKTAAIRLITVGDTTFQIFGKQLTVNGRPLGEDEDEDEQGVVVLTPDPATSGGGQDSPGKAAAVEFAKTAEEVGQSGKTGLGSRQRRGRKRGT